MTDNASDSRPLDLSDLREADTLGQAWDAWLRDDIEPTRHEASQKLAAGIAATVEELYDWDDAPKAPSSFRTGLKRDLLHMHDALRVSGAAAAPDSWEDPPTAGSQGAAAIPLPLPATEKPAKAKRFRALRSWLPAVEVAAACVLIAALLGVAFANDRIAEFFRDEESGNFASQGDTPLTPTIPSAGSEPGIANAVAQPEEAGVATASSFDRFEEDSILFSGTLSEGWKNPVAASTQAGSVPEHIVVEDAYIAVVSVDDSTMGVTLSVYASETGERMWRAEVNDNVNETQVGRNAAPIIADGKVYFVNRAGFVYIIDIESYLEDQQPDVAMQLQLNTVGERMLLANGILYVAGGGGSYAPTIAGYGESIFMTATGFDAIFAIDSTTGYASVMVSIPADQQDPSRPGLYRYDLTSAQLSKVWDQPVAIPTDVNVLDNQALAVTFHSEAKTTPGIWFLNPVDMSELTVFEAESIIDPAVVAQKAAVVTLYNDMGDVELRAIQVDGSNVPLDSTWEIRSRSAPIVGGDATIVVTDLDTIQLFDPASGDMIGETSVGMEHGQITALDTNAGSVFVSFEDGTVARYDSKTAPQQAEPEPMTQPQE